MTIRTVVVDDEKPARDRLKRFLTEQADFELVGEAGDGDTALRVIEELRPDLVILDVQMPEMDGFEVLRRLKSVPRVIFATAYERYAVQAFEVHSIDYLLKPFDRKRFGTALARVREEIRKSLPAEEKLDALLREIRESTQALKAAAGASESHPAVEDSGRAHGAHAGTGKEAPASSAGAGARASGGARATGAAGAPGAAGSQDGAAGQAEGPTSPRPSSDRIPGRRGPKIYLLAPGEILWFEAEGELVFARSGAHRYLVPKTLTELEASLDPRQFFRCHRSFIVNLAGIAEIAPEDSGNYRIIIRDPARPWIPLSRRQARKLREVFPW